MALYVPAGRRRTRKILSVVVALIVGIVAGVFIGRGTAPGVGSRVSSVRAEAQSAVGTLEALPNEYAKQQSRSSQFRAGGGVGDALARARQDLDGALPRASWLGQTSRSEVKEALDRVQNAASTHASREDFTTAVNGAVSVVNRVFGLDSAGAQGAASRSGTRLGVTLTEWKFTPNRSTVPTGTVSFDIRNVGSYVHEMLIIKMGLAAADLPVDHEGMLDELGQGVDFVDEVEDVDPGTSANPKVDLEPGRYMLVCNKPPDLTRGIPGHLHEKMYTTFDVSGV